MITPRALEGKKVILDMLRKSIKPTGINLMMDLFSDDEDAGTN